MSIILRTFGTMRKLRFKIVLVLALNFGVVSYMILYAWRSSSQGVPYIRKSPPRSSLSPQYLLDIQANRINSLFKVLWRHEDRFSAELDHLKILSFHDLVAGKHSLSTYSKEFKQDMSKYIVVGNESIEVTDSFVKHLRNMSEFYLETKSRKRNVVKFEPKSDSQKPVILTASNSKYFGRLQNTIYMIKNNYPNHTLIIYDLGMGDSKHKVTKSYCQCEVIKFDFSKYERLSKHMAQLKTYAWKPVIIQETLNRYDKVLYIDSSIRLYTSQIGHQMSVLNDLGILTQFIDFNLVCYTHPDMFSWFDLNIVDYEDVYTIDANLIMFQKSFLTTLIMKAWVTCALDMNCIAPIGSRLKPCCGCHRYDQDALTIITGYFYIHKYLPRQPLYTRTELVSSGMNEYCPISFSNLENYFYTVNRGELMYMDVRWQQIFL